MCSFLVLPPSLSREGSPRGHSWPGNKNTASCVMVLPGDVHQRLGAQGLYWGLAMQAPSAQHASKFQTPIRKAGVWYKPHCLYKQLRHSEPRLSFRERFVLIQGAIYQSQSRCHQWPTLKAGLSKDSSHKPATCSFLHQEQAREAPRSRTIKMTPV